LEIKSYLKNLELSKKEIKTYLACLELGESHIVPISQKVGIPRTTLVYILDGLKERGLIEIVPKRGRRLYLPLPPRTLVTLYKQRRDKMDEQLDSLQSALPELNRLYSLTPFQPKVRFFQGQDELRQLYEEMLQAPVNEIVYIGDVQEIEMSLGANYLKTWVRRRSDAQIKTRGIRIRSGEVDDPAYTQTREYNRNLRYAPEGFASPSNILIYADTVVVMTTAKESLGLAITSRDYATTMKAFFTEVWNGSSSK